MQPGDFPLQSRCDLRKPSEAFAWMLVALPQIRGAALPMPSEYLQMVSEHMWDCGARVPNHKVNGVRVPDKQTKWWSPPGAGDPHWLTNPGIWTYGKKPPPPKEGPTMLTMLEAMKKADEENFMGALDKVMRGEKDGNGSAV
jgi:hypothetical protein